MEHITFHPNAGGSFKVAILGKESSLSKANYKKFYVNSLVSQGCVAYRDILAIGLRYDNGKITAKEARGFLDNNILPTLKSLGVKVVFVLDAAYFGYLTKQKYTKSFGTYHPNRNDNPEYDQMVKVIPLPSYNSFFANPVAKEKVPVCISVLGAALKGLPVTLGADALTNYRYWTQPNHVISALESLLAANHPELSVDIEGFSLDFTECGVGTIAFSHDEHTALSLAVQYRGWDADTPTFENREVLDALKVFFETYEGKTIYHNAKFDIKSLIFTIWMKGLGDREGLVTGLRVLTKNYEDTQLLTYLATNTCAGNVLDLKSNTIEYMGNYSQEAINDITKISLFTLLKYNGEDGVATQYLYNKYIGVITERGQLYLYREVLMNATTALIQLEMEGMHLHYPKVEELTKKLEARSQTMGRTLAGMPMIAAFEMYLRKSACLLANLSMKVKVKVLSDFDHVEFNPSSNIQVADLLHKFLGLEVIDETNKGNPSTSRDSLLKIRQALTEKYKL